MKKMLVVALTVLTFLTLYAVCAFAEAMDTPDEIAAVEFNHKVYEANRLDALFSRHESVTYAFTYPLNPEAPWSVRETRDSVYQEWGTNNAQFDRDRIVYSMSCDAETGALSTSCGVNYDPDYDPFYSFVNVAEEIFYNVEHDHVVQIDEQDGLIHSVSEFDETLSRQYVENELGMDYAGQIIRSELFLDSETWELLKSVETMACDGKETVVCAIETQYDAPEPLACRILRANFERASENMMTLTYVIDAGTDHELSRMLKVPVNTEASQLFGDAPVAYFNDADCKTLFHWDRMSDQTFYVFTNPDETLTARFQTLYEALIQETQNPEPDSAAFEALVAANTGKEILSRHANLQMRFSSFRDEEVIYNEYHYRDADTFLWRFGNGYASLYRPDLWGELKADDQGYSCTYTIFNTIENAQNAFEDARDYGIILPDEAETLVETIDAGDGLFVAVTEISDPQRVEKIMALDAAMGGYAYADGMTLRFQYTFDRETSDLLNAVVFLIDAAGESHTYERFDPTYDVEDYDPAAEGEPFAEYYADMSNPEKRRTIKVVFSPDTDNEQSITCDLPRSASFIISCDGETIDKVYTDRECTRLYERSDSESDLELYVK